MMHQLFAQQVPLLFCFIVTLELQHTLARVKRNEGALFFPLGIIDLKTLKHEQCFVLLIKVSIH